MPLPLLIKDVGRYNVIRPLGRGAMGEVYLAQDPLLGREVAIKIVRQDLDLTASERHTLADRMRNEAKAAASLSHAHIVALHDLIDDESLGVCLVFEYVGGITLKSFIEDRGSMSADDVVQLALEIGDALTLAHEHGVIHRDIKPANIILSDQGAKLTDFGIARIPNSTLTRTGGIMGTPAYSAPETLQGKNYSSFSDQFSFAATLYEALCGVRAFPGDDALTVMDTIRQGPPRPLALPDHVPALVGDVLSKGLHPSLDHRYPSCRQLAERLSAALPSSDVSFRPTRKQAEEPLMGGEGRSRLTIGLGAAVAGALTATILITAARPPAPRAYQLVRRRVDRASMSTSRLHRNRPRLHHERQPKAKPLLPSPSTSAALSTSPASGPTQVKTSTGDSRSAVPPTAGAQPPVRKGGETQERPMER